MWNLTDCHTMDNIPIDVAVVEASTGSFLEFLSELLMDGDIGDDEAVQAISVIAEEILNGTHNGTQAVV